MQLRRFLDGAQIEMYIRLVLNLDEILVISKTGLVSTWKYADETTLTAHFTAHTYTVKTF